MFQISRSYTEVPVNISNVNNESRRPVSRVVTALSIISFVVSFVIAVVRITHRVEQSSTIEYVNIDEEIVPNNVSSIQVAFIGNSILYFNDQPRFLSNLFSHVSSSKISLSQDSCLRGGASLISIYTKGNGMENKFNTPSALLEDGSYDIGSPNIQSLLLLKHDKPWDFVVMNDYTQSPARIKTREETVKFLEEKYAPLFLQKTKKIIPVLLMTSAYRKPIQNTSDIGSVDEFTYKLCKGYEEYADSLNKVFQQNISRIARVGQAYHTVYLENRNLWEKLFYIDDKHPSVHGSFLMGNILYWTILEEEPPLIRTESDIRNLWSDARRMYPPEDNTTIVFPTIEEAMYLRDVAGRVWQLQGC